MHTLLALATLLAGTLASTAERARDFRAWRTRQRAELALLTRPVEPPGTGHPVDRFVAKEWAGRSVSVPAAVDDATFLRRLSLEVVGLLPTVAELDAFIADPSPDKRPRRVAALLADRDAYAEHWMTFWNDLLRNDEQTNIDGLRKPITRWLYQSLRENKPLDEFVAELLDPGPDGPEGYLIGVNWRGRVNASQTPPVQAAQNVSQVFLASSIKCASCHNSFINAWKLDQAYGMASFFATTNLEVHRCDKPTGKIAPPRFLFAGLGDVPAAASLPERRRAVSLMVTRPANPRFARAVVNRLWKRLLGWALVEPADDFDGKVRPPALLDWLAYDFMAHDYDVKHTLRLILTSQVYQVPAAAPAGKEKMPTRPRERRLTAEQFLDGVSQVTGYWPRPELMDVAVDNPAVRAWRYRKPGALAVALGRPNREQICTQRDEESTVLQALELVNGAAFTARLERSAEILLASDLGRADQALAATELYRRALGRQPTQAERVEAQTFLGSPGQGARERHEGWEDFLWVLFVRPEFQFIR